MPSFLYLVVLYISSGAFWLFGGALAIWAAVHVGLLVHYFVGTDRNDVVRFKHLKEQAVGAPIGAVICFVLAGVLAPSSPNQSQAASPSPRSSNQSIWRDIEISEDARLNPSIPLRGYAREFRSMALSASGYPIVETKRTMPVCRNPGNLRMAVDLVRADRDPDAARVSGCLVLPAGTRAEWLRPPFQLFGLSVIEVRLHPARGLPIDIYGTHPVGEWFR